MAILKNSIDDLATSATKLQAVHISELEFPPSPPNTNHIHAKFQALIPQLSDKALINLPSDGAYKENVTRWSERTATNPAAVVNVACEKISAPLSVFHLLSLFPNSITNNTTDNGSQSKCSTENIILFLAQSGGHGLSFSISKLAGKERIIINLRAMNGVMVDLENGRATASAGALTKEFVDAAHAADAHEVIGVCNSVGIIPALLRGGLGNFISLYGLGVDNILSARLVTAEGKVATVSEMENRRLFWGLRGAGHKFGVVSELTVKAYEQVIGGVHWGEWWLSLALKRWP
jgi:hypothetical protein